MSRNAKVSDHSLRFGLFQGLDSSVGREDLINLFLSLNIMKLPGINMVSLQVFKAFLQQPHRTIVSTIMGFCG